MGGNSLSYVDRKLSLLGQPPKWIKTAKSTDIDSSGGDTNRRKRSTAMLQAWTIILIDEAVAISPVHVATTHALIASL